MELLNSANVLFGRVKPATDVQQPHHSTVRLCCVREVLVHLDDTEVLARALGASGRDLIFGGDSDVSWDHKI
jgi:hypothetical protein